MYIYLYTSDCVKIVIEKKQGQEQEHTKTEKIDRKREIQLSF